MKYSTRASRVLPALLLFASPLSAQTPTDRVATAHDTGRLGDWSVRQPLTSCVDYLQASPDQRRWYAAGLNQGLFAALGFVGLERSMALTFKATGGGAVGDSASVKLDGLHATQAALNKMLPNQPLRIAGLVALLTEACSNATDSSLPVFRFYREVVAETHK